MVEETLKDAKHKMEMTIDAVEKDLGGLRTGRANASILDRIEAEAYGASMPLNQLATITVPQPRLLHIQPFDAKTIGAIEKAILKSDLGITPNNDGKAIKLEFPALTEERRKEMAKMAHKKTEDGKIAIRNVRRDSKDKIEKMEKNKEITEDDKKRGLDKLQKITDEFVVKLDGVYSKKEKEILEF